MVCAAALAAGCSVVVSSAAGDMADSLSVAMMNQDDPELVREALPAYLLLLDSVVESDPENEQVLSAAAQLYAGYGSVFVSDPTRAARLTTRARAYAERALCLSDKQTCGLNQTNFQEFTKRISELDESSSQTLYSYCIANLAYIRAHSDDLKSLAGLPRVQFALEYLVMLDPDSRNEASIYSYLGVLYTLRPAALGGQPEQARGYFEKADSLSAGKDLSIKVEYANSYARLLYDRNLHDRLLNEVMAADVKQPGLTLTNVLAQQAAAELLASAEEYF
ncbi:MAG: TRAP transporter TatT component family protein [Gammaproteobacteria bacterium]